MLHVVKRGEREFAVVNDRGEQIRSYYDSAAAAWHHAVWGPYLAADRLPIVAPGGRWFKTNDKTRRVSDALTTDPREAKAIAREEATPEQIAEAEKAIAAFIRHKITDDPMEAFNPMPEDFEFDHDPNDYDADLIDLTDDETHEAAEQAALAEQADDDYPDPPEDYDPEPENASDNPEDAASEPLSIPEGGWTIDHIEALREALSDSERNAFDNFRHMAETVGSEAGREFWQAQAREVLREATA